MAKLSARGRYCLAEVTKELTEAELQARLDERYPSSLGRCCMNNDTGCFDQECRCLCDHCHAVRSRVLLITWERITLRLMSDGKILEKRDVRFKPDWLDTNGRRHSYGWTTHAKIKSGLSASDFVRIYTQDRKDGSPSKWTGNLQGPDLRF